jgi:hypothetical protein
MPVTAAVPSKHHRCRSCRDEHPHDRARWCRDCLYADAMEMPRVMTPAERTAAGVAILREFYGAEE